MTPFPPQPPAARRRRWWNARREEKAVRVSRWLAAVAALALVVLGWWVVRYLMVEPEGQLATTCAVGPAALGSITAAGGPDAVGTDADALAPYQKLPAMTHRWLGDLRSAASRADDRELSRRAFLAMRAGGLTVAADHLAVIERECAERMSRAGVDAQPREWFVP